MNNNILRVHFTVHFASRSTRKMYRKMYSQYIIVHTKYSSIPKNVLMKNYKTVF